MNYQIPEHIIDELRTRADLVEIVSESVTMKKSGKNYLGLCPFHSEKTPSFTVSPEKQIFHCFGCGNGGNVFKFIMAREDVSFVDAIRKLASRYGVPLPQAKPGSREASVKNEREQFLRFNEISAKYFQSRLTDPAVGKVARDYIAKRGFSEETVEYFQLGWAEKSWNGLLQNLQKSAFASPAQLAKAGLVKQGDDSGNYYDRFRERLIIPLKDANGNIIGFAGRVLGEGNPKYLNSPETSLYKKGNHLFGLHGARQDIREHDQVLIVEGYFDQIVPYQYGIKNVVAACGTALTARQVSLLRNYTRNAVLVFDADQAGSAAADRGFDVLIEQGMMVRVAALPKGQDPDSFLRENGAEAFLRLIDQAKPFVEHFIEKSMAAGDPDSMQGRVEIVNRLLPLLGKIKNNIERSQAVQMVSERVGVDDHSLLAEMKKALARNETQVKTEVLETQAKTRRPPEWYLVHIMLADSAQAQDILDQVSPDDFQNPVCRNVIQLISRQFSEGKPVSADRLVDVAEDAETRQFLTQVAMTPLEFEDLKMAARECMSQLKRENMKGRIHDLKQQMVEAEKAGLTVKSRELFNQVKEIKATN